MAQVTAFRDLPLSDLRIERFQARKQNAGEGLDELAASIERWGLLQPIVVCTSSKDASKWEIVCGQRRYLAHQKILQRSTITAGVIPHVISVEEGLALSASENVVRLDMTRKDLIDLCSQLHKRYGTIQYVADETKLPYPIVRKYIRYDGLPADLRTRVDANEINVDLAMKIQDAATAQSGNYDSAESERLVKTLKTVDNALQRKILTLRKRHPEKDLEEVVRTAEQPDRSLKLSLVVGEGLAVPLKQFADDEDMDEKAAVLGFIEDSLGRHGYLGDEE